MRSQGIVFNQRKEPFLFIFVLSCSSKKSFSFNMKYCSILLIILASCTSKDTQQTKLVYDETSLKTFVLSTHGAYASQVSNELDSILKDASKDSTVFRQTISYLETPFSNPNSSYRNQDLYSKLLEAEVNSPYFIPYEKQVAAGKLKLLQQNNIGHPANNFTYITPKEDKRQMYEIKADYLILYFNNPECPACKEMRDVLAKSEVIGLNVKSGRLKVLSIYTDNDLKPWLKHLKDYPKEWIQGRDENEYLYKNKVYDLRAIPTVYLLDSNKKVLLKDCVDVGQIERAVSPM